MSADTETPNVTDDLWADGPKSFSFDGVAPITIRGKVIQQERAQQTNFDTGQPEFWPDGRPAMKNIVTVYSEELAADGDDGIRAIHAKIPGGIHTAIKAAIREASARTLLNGDTLTLTWVSGGEKVPGQKKNTQKEYEALIEPANQPPF